ncbi:MAG: hypothetical protein ACSHYB_17955 [Roseibacillus sp.]
MKQPLALLLVTSFASAELVDITLTLTPVTASENKLALTLQVPILGNDSDTSDVSGTIAARIDIDPGSGTISTLELLSGDIDGTAVSFSQSSIFGNYNISTSAIGGTVDTPAPPAPVSSSQSAAELHEFTINAGTLTGSVTPLFSATTNIAEDFSLSPVTGPGTAGDFVNLSSTANAGASSPTLAVYDLDFDYPIDITQEVDVGVTVTFLASGTMRATGQVSIPVIPPNPFLTWATSNGDASASFEGNDFSPLLPNGLLWALGYNAGETPRHLEPIASNSSSFNVTPPVGGTITDIAVQLSFDLSDPNAWNTISTIPAGTTTAQGPFGGGTGTAFLRLSAEEPSN